MTQTSSTLPGPTDHLSNLNCSSTNSLVSCPAVYAYPYDAWGNFNGSSSSASCPAWEFVDGNDFPFNISPYNEITGLNASGHSSESISRAYHMDGQINCKVGGVTKGSTILNVTTVINRPYTFSCENWSCSGVTSGDVPRSLCTLTNNSGYDFASVNITPPNNGTVSSENCTGGVSGVSTAGSCHITITGAIDSSSIGLSVEGILSAAQNSLATLAHPQSVSISGGNAATVCP